MKFIKQNSAWRKLQQVEGFRYKCAFCDSIVHSYAGLRLGRSSDGTGPRTGGVFICPNCGGPTSFDEDGNQIPGPLLGNPVAHVPDTLYSLYEEARLCTAHSAYTAAVMLLRKMLMNIAVEHGADEGLRFVDYVDFLLENDLVQKRAKPWVKKIKDIGNEANHKIEPKTREQALQALTFVEMILRTNYEFLHPFKDNPET